MLLPPALDQIAELPRTVPKARLDAFLMRMKSGCDIETALALELLGPSDLAKLEPIRRQETLVRDPRLLAELIEHAYRQAKEAPAEPEVVWTGPRLDPTIPYIGTSAAARRIVDNASKHITIAGYHVTSEALESIHLWRALQRGVTVSLFVDGSDLKVEDKHIFISRGVRVRTVSAAAKDYSKFHVKALVADDSNALVGSANFTTLGYSTNIELGVALEGTAAATVGAMLRSYVAFAESAGWVVSK